MSAGTVIVKDMEQKSLGIKYIALLIILVVFTILVAGALVYRAYTSDSFFQEQAQLELADLD
jgi:hypothetical protein